MSQREKDERIRDLIRVAIAAEQVVDSYEQCEPRRPGFVDLDPLRDALDHYWQRWGEEVDDHTQQG